MLVLPSSVVYVILFKELFFLFETWRKGNAFFLFPPNFSGSFFPFFPETFGFRLGFPTSPAVSGTAYITSLTAISLDCGCKSRHFLHHHQMFYRLFLKYFLSILNVRKLQRKKKNGGLIRSCFEFLRKNSYAAFSKFASGLFLRSYSSHSPLCSS